MYTDIYGREHRYAPPLGYVQKDGTVHFCAADEWAAQVKRGLRFEPYGGADTHVRISRGTCLNPLIVAGDRMRIRPVAEDETLIDGGLYLIRWHDESEVQLYRDSINLKGTEPIIIAKYLRFFAGQWWILCKDSMHRLNGTIVGQIVGKAVPSPEIAPAVHAPQLGQNAATQILINNSSAGTTGITGFTGLISLGVVLNPTGPLVACSLIVTATITARQTVGTAGQMKLVVRYADDGSTFVSAAQEIPISGASYQSFTLQWQFAHVLANAGIGGQIGIYVDNTGPSTNSFDWQAATLQSEFILR
jgi:hypothetical protein